MPSLKEGDRLHAAAWNHQNKYEKIDAIRLSLLPSLHVLLAVITCKNVVLGRMNGSRAEKVVLQVH